ncbi:ParB/RepB/Spo0J family partition protein [Paludisphaera mucosa]|uniref:ParB/RepB/Spo0J family partition protein n=1 Tax=Paludisphaera mucosa TaxID=3030827 RepID=A0ABT6FL04_9BACT|nr:ParB/RepB/Spo0J family partition protein [Paludisphaera mucosa]MDG3008257.1 ParB/RepB/Spo0J family partition protein [Paludisphaera mucosa]
MGKLDELLKAGGANIAESMGAGRPKMGSFEARMEAKTSSVPSRWQGVAKSKNAVEIPVDKIVPDPDQPREEFEPDALARLAESLKTRGQLQPIRVRWDEAQDRYVVVCGERRWRAAGLAGLASLSCVVSEGPIDEGELRELQLIENCLREDLRPIEQAKAFRALMDRNGWSGNQTAKALGVAQPTVVRALALLHLPEPVQGRVEEGTLPPGTAYEIGKIQDPAIQRDLAERVVSEGLSRAEAVEAVRVAARRTPSTVGKGRGARRGDKAPTTRTLRAAGCKITVENRKGVDDALLAAALREALEQLAAQAELAA